MKRTVALFLSIIIIIGLTACQNTESDSCDLPSGTYYMVGEFEELMTPYLALNFEDHTFRMGAGSLVSYQEYGSFIVSDNRITATSQSTVFAFEIKDNNTLILVDNGDNEYFMMPENAEYIFRNNS